MIFETLQSQLIRFKFHSFGSKLQKILEFNLLIEHPGRLPSNVHPTRPGDRLRTKSSTSDPVYNHCLAVFMENFADYDNPRQESISETVIVIFGILFMGMCSKKKSDSEYLMII